MAVALFYETRAWAHVLKGLVELCVHDMTIEACNSHKSGPLKLTFVRGRQMEALKFAIVRGPHF